MREHNAQPSVRQQFRGRPLPLRREEREPSNLRRLPPRPQHPSPSLRSPRSGQNVQRLSVAPDPQRRKRPVEMKASEVEVLGPTPASRAQSDAAFAKNHPGAPEGLSGDALRAWQASIGNPLPKEEDLGSKVRAANPEPTRAEVKAAQGGKSEGQAAQTGSRVATPAAPKETAGTPNQPARVPPAQATVPTPFQEGDAVTLPDGRRAKVDYVAPADKTPTVRVRTDDGEKVSLTRQKEIDQLQPATKYKHGNTQANIPEGSEAHTALETARARISNSDLAGKGKEVDGNHVTVRYGIQSDDTEGIKKYLASLSPFEAKLGKTAVFPPSDSSDGAAVVHAPIESPELQTINAEIEKHGDFAKSNFPEYRPHATIAFVKPDKADRYANMLVTKGQKFPVNEIAITDKNGKQTVVRLEGKGETKDGSVTKVDNPFRGKALAAREKADRLNRPTAHDAAMEKAFPLGGGFGRPGASKRIDGSVHRATEAVDAKKNADYLEAQAAAYDRGEINAQGRRITLASQARSVKREEYQDKRSERVDRAKAELKGKERWQVPANVYADSTNNLGGGARALVLNDHRESVEKAIADGKAVPTEVLKDYPDLRDQQIRKYLKSKGHNDEYIANFIADKNKPESKPVVATSPEPTPAIKGNAFKDEEDERGHFKTLNGAVDVNGNWGRLKDLPGDTKVILYHATTEANAKAILASGFTRGEKPTNYGGDRDYTYLGGYSEGWGLGSYLGGATYSGKPELSS